MEIPIMTQDRESGCWVLSFQYSDITFDVEVTGACDYRVIAWIDGGSFRYETKAEREYRHLETEANGEMPNDDAFAHFPPYEEAIQERVEDCLNRFKAVAYIVNFAHGWYKA